MGCRERERWRCLGWEGDGEDYVIYHTKVGFLDPSSNMGLSQSLSSIVLSHKFSKNKWGPVKGNIYIRVLFFLWDPTNLANIYLKYNCFISDLSYSPHWLWCLFLTTYSDWNSNSTSRDASTNKLKLVVNFEANLMILNFVPFSSLYTNTLYQKRNRKSGVCRKKNPNFLINWHHLNKAKPHYGLICVNFWRNGFGSVKMVLAALAMAKILAALPCHWTCCICFLLEPVGQLSDIEGLVLVMSFGAVESYL